jgi:glycosyltransferase involved in cell wall biosynthesis
MIDRSADGRLRVLWLIKGLGPGGAERLLTSAAAVRDREAFAYEAVYLLPWKDALAPELEALGVPVRCLDVRDERDLRWSRRLRRMLVEHPVDIVHVHSPYAAGVARLVIRTLPRESRPRLVSTEHNEWSRFALGSRVLNGLTVPLSDSVIAVSEKVRQSIWRPLRPRVETVIHGVPIDQVRARRNERAVVRRELEAQPGELLVGTIANYSPKKDYPNLLHAARRLADGEIPVRFIVVGQGPLEREVRELRDQLGLRAQVELLGYRDDAVRMMAGCDLFVLASRFEGLPVAIMEALVLGLPVVATTVGGIPEAVRHGVEGMLVPARRPDLLADAIEQLVLDADRRETMATAAAARGEHFDISRAVRRCEAIYRAIVSQ